MSGRLPERKTEKREKIDKEKYRLPGYLHLQKAQNVLALRLSRLVGRPATESYIVLSHHPTTPTTMTFVLACSYIPIISAQYKYLRNQLLQLCTARTVWCNVGFMVRCDN